MAGIPDYTIKQPVPQRRFPTEEYIRGMTNQPNKFDNMRQIVKGVTGGITEGLQVSEAVSKIMERRKATRELADLADYLTGKGVKKEAIDFNETDELGNKVTKKKIVETPIPAPKNIPEEVRIPMSKLIKAGHVKEGVELYTDWQKEKNKEDLSPLMELTESQAKAINYAFPAKTTMKQSDFIKALNATKQPAEKETPEQKYLRTQLQILGNKLTKNPDESTESDARQYVEFHNQLNPDNPMEVDVQKPNWFQSVVNTIPMLAKENIAKVKPVKKGSTETMMIRVRDKKTGEAGSLPASEFNSELYDKI